MKTKPILIAVSVFILTSSAFLSCKNQAKFTNSDVINFLISFNKQLKISNNDGLLTNFESNKTSKALDRLFNILSGRTGLKDKAAPLFNLDIDLGKSTFKTLNNEFVEVTVPVYFTHKKVEKKQSSILFKIHHLADNKFKIAQIDGTKLMADYVAYNKIVRNKTAPPDKNYSPITLEAFETAKQLRSRYDSVIWFSHVKDSTYFYVVKGKCDGIYSSEHLGKSYKMGLVSPDLKEIIPTKYDLIHNIDGTFNGLIEVEKDKKRGFYDLNGKIIIPVVYDEVLPLKTDEALAVLRKGNDYYWLKKDYSISAKDASIKIADILPKIKAYQMSYNYNNKVLKYVTEFNSKQINGCIYIAPSYLADWGIFSVIQTFKNPIRKNIDYGEDSAETETITYNVKFVNVANNNSWLRTALYSLRDNYIGGRSAFYESKNILIADKKRNKVYGYTLRSYEADEELPELSGLCPDYGLRSINDSLLEVKVNSSSQLSSDVYSMNELSSYHYLKIKNGRIKELPSERKFSCTQYVKLDDSFVNGCYVIDDKRESRLPMEVLEFMKMEIYAHYRYQFPDEKWKNVFSGIDGENASVDDSLTTIDRYNINWINQKLNNYQAKSR